MAGLSEKLRVIAVGGPTATGKTALSVALAKRFGAEIISADSMQIYRGLDVGTAKVTPEEQQGIPHHLLDILPPEEPYSVADFTADASRLITEISGRGHLPIVAGGTGLYITSLLNGVRFAPEKTDPAIRARLQRRAAEEGTEVLYRTLQEIDAEYAKKVHPNNLPRVIRALELYEATGRRMSEEQAESRPQEKPYRSICLCLTCRDRAVLYRRIDRRVDQMMEQGLLAEAEQVWRKRDRYRTAAQAIGYKEFFPFFEGTADCSDCVNRLKQATRNYAKRQLTWFRHQNDAIWLYTDDPGAEEQAITLVEQFLQAEKPY